MTKRQRHFVCMLSTGRKVMAWGNVSAKNPKLMFGKIDTDPRQLRQPELDEFLHWWRDLEERHVAQGMQIQFRFGAFANPSKPPPRLHL